ncbi:hypothetical protein B0A50_04054 [Salinomyces thailandicus]|uniref:RNA-dependent RNA polymerase n=1 Tax=Salinomyces thailandicus TaxID=706561 RepID=A0A4U0TZR3_9PEZI|nr:hypothetical protein B0A50_04054 [Salinomyces thailandica]
MAVVSHLRDIKYRGRIPVEHGVTLYGIMDETGYLREGEVYVTRTGPDGRRDDTPRSIVITRSPAMHPGDVQVVNAVTVPADSPLKRLSNVVVFSQHGSRDLASQLSGGDLDGDLYNIVWDSRLIPAHTYQAADYPRVSPVELDRLVTSKDMSDFFVTFMETDQLGMLCNIHLQLADQLPTGTFSAECLKLAGMASTAVDYSKTGIAVDMTECPKYDRCRPDFMAPSPRVFVSGEGYLGFEDEDYQDDEAFEGLDIERRAFRYYESQKALGELFRAIDERQFLHSLQHDRQRFIEPASKSLLRPLDLYGQNFARNYGILWQHNKDLARDIKASYEEGLIGLAYQFEPTARCPLSEYEVFTGSILGRQGGQQGKTLREMSKSLRERFETVVEYVVARITKGDRAVREVEDLDDFPDDREFEALPRAIACLNVAATEEGWRDRQMGELGSFGYIAVGVAMREMRRFLITTTGSYALLPLVAREASGAAVGGRGVEESRPRQGTVSRWQ